MMQRIQISILTDDLFTPEKYLAVTEECETLIAWVEFDKNMF